MVLIDVVVLGEERKVLVQPKPKTEEPGTAAV